MHTAFAAATGHAILERCGMTETLITLSNPLQGVRRAGSVGTPVCSVASRVVDDACRPVGPGTMGELQIRGNSLMTDYSGDADARRTHTQ